MRRLFPHPCDAIDLGEAYAYPPSRPWLRANMVASLDGAATANGLSGSLSGPADKQIFSVLRGLADVVLVGAATVRMEGYGPVRPKFVPQERRRAHGQTPVPAVAIVSAHLDLDPAATIFTEATARTLVITVEDAPRPRVEALRPVADMIIAGEHRVDLTTALDTLTARGYHRQLCEGGPHLLAQLVAADRLDELCLTISPLLTAGTAPRILAGLTFVEPHRLALSQLLEEDGVLFTRYLRT
jgi:riboflavin biosynthesis pyrimidine reductase